MNIDTAHNVLYNAVQVCPRTLLSNQKLVEGQPAPGLRATVPFFCAARS